MLKTARLPNMLKFWVKNNNGKVVRYGISSGNSSIVIAKK